MEDSKIVKCYIFGQALEHLLNVRGYFEKIDLKKKRTNACSQCCTSCSSLFSLLFKRPYEEFYNLLRDAGFPEEDVKKICFRN